MGRKLGRNKKRSWKQVNIDEVEDKLEQDRLDERVGRKASDFIISTVGNEHVESPQIKKSNAKRSKLANPSEIAASINCYKALENTSKVQPAIRPLQSDRKTKEKEPYIFASKKPEAVKTPEFFDLWEQKPESDGLLSQKSVKVPANLFQKPLLLQSVVLPEPGQSYNPEKKAYSNLVRKVVKKEKKVLAKASKIERQAASVKRAEVEIEKDYMNEMSQGLDLHAHDENTDADEEKEDESPVISKAPAKKESKKTKKKKKKVKVKTVVKGTQPVSIKKILKEVKEEEAIAELNRKRRDAKIASQLHKPKKVRGIREEDKITLALPSDITGSLRSTKIIGNLLRERFTSLQERSLVDYPKRELKTRAKARVKPWTKFSVKRSYKDAQQ